MLTHGKLTRLGVIRVAFSTLANIDRMGGQANYYHATGSVLHCMVYAVRTCKCARSPVFYGRAPTATAAVAAAATCCSVGVLLAYLCVCALVFVAVCACICFLFKTVIHFNRTEKETKASNASGCGIGKNRAQYLKAEH